MVADINVYVNVDDTELDALEEKIDAVEREIDLHVDVDDRELDEAVAKAEALDGATSTIDVETDLADTELDEQTQSVTQEVDTPDVESVDVDSEALPDGGDEPLTDGGHDGRFSVAVSEFSAAVHEFVAGASTPSASQDGTDPPGAYEVEAPDLDAPEMGDGDGSSGSLYSDFGFSTVDIFDDDSLLGRGIDKIDDITDSMEEFTEGTDDLMGSMRNLIPSMETWYNLLAAIIPLLIAGGVNLAGLGAAGLGALGAGAIVIGGGLLGHGMDPQSAISGAKEEIKELGADLYETFEGAFQAFAPIQSELFRNLPEYAEEFAEQLEGLTVFEGLIDSSVQGFFNWLAWGADVLSQYEPMISQLVNRFGEMGGQLFISAFRWLIEEAYRNQDVLIGIGAVLVDIGAILYNLSLAVSRVLITLKPFFDILVGITGLLNNDLIVAIGIVIAWIVALNGAIWALSGAQAALVIAGQGLTAMFLNIWNTLIGLPALLSTVTAAMTSTAIQFSVLGYTITAAWWHVLAVLLLVLAAWEALGDAPMIPDFGGGSDGPGSDLFGGPPAPPMANPDVTPNGQPIGGRGGGGQSRYQTEGQPVVQNTFRVYGNPDDEQMAKMQDLAGSTARKEDEIARTRNVANDYQTTNDDRERRQ